MAANMYRVGDCVYFETASSQPYQVRRLEELTKTSGGAVEARVRCFYRRRDLPASLIKQAERCYGLAWEQDSSTDEQNNNNQNQTENEDSKDNGACESKEQPAEDGEPAATSPTRDQAANTAADTTATLNGDKRPFRAAAATGGAHRHQQLEHRELFLSRHVETLPATQIRGKCVVTLLCEEAETPDCYLADADRFFYSLVYDPAQRTLRVDEGEMRVGGDYQADVPPWLSPATRSPPAGSSSQARETLVWRPDNQLDEQQVSRFITLAKSVGTFARALSGGELDSSSSVSSSLSSSSSSSAAVVTCRPAGLHRTAAAACRDATLQFALDTLHRCEYDVARAVAALVPSPGGPVMCCDELEHWSTHESRVFDDAYETCGKDFGRMRAAHLPWKSAASVVEYFYMWKASDRFVRRRRAKTAATEAQLKQVYIPQYSASSGGGGGDGGVNGELTNGGGVGSGSGGCDACAAAPAVKWTTCGELRLCALCRQYWKRYGAAPLPGTDVTAALTASSQLQSQQQQQQQPPPATAATTRVSERPECSVVSGGGAAGRCVRASFLMLPTWLAVAARQLCVSARVLRRMARGGTLAATTAAVTAALTPTVVRQRCGDDLPAVAAACRQQRLNSRRKAAVPSPSTISSVSRRLWSAQQQRQQRRGGDGAGGARQLGAGVTLTRHGAAAVRSSSPTLSGAAPAAKRARDSVTITALPVAPPPPLQRRHQPAAGGRRGKPSTTTAACVNAGAAAAAAVVGRHDAVVYVAGAALRRGRHRLYGGEALRRISRRPCHRPPTPLS